MIFAHTHEQVLAGTKTQTRRLHQHLDSLDLVDGRFLEAIQPVSGTFVLTADCRMKYAVGNTYAVQPGRGKRAVGRIRVTGLRVERLQALTEADAQAEGVESVQAYAALWDAIHSKRGERWSDNPLVVVIQFELADASQR